MARTVQRVVALIPARGGSTGVVRKNLRTVAGKPLLAYAIQSALEATTIQRTIVSTEDKEIAQVAESCGVEAFVHPPALSTANAPTFPVIQWDLEALRSEGDEPALVVVLRATSPLRLPEDINAAVQLLKRNPQADSVVSVVPAVGIHPIRLKKISPGGQLTDAFESEGSFPKRRQELEPLYMRNGAVYVSRPHVIDAGGLWGASCLTYVMPEERSLNINTDHQLRVAELLLTYGSAWGADLQ